MVECLNSGRVCPLRPPIATGLERRNQSRRMSRGEITPMLLRHFISHSHFEHRLLSSGGGIEMARHGEASMSDGKTYASHDNDGKQVLWHGTGGAVVRYDSPVEIDYGSPIPARIDGAWSIKSHRDRITNFEAGTRVVYNAVVDGIERGNRGERIVLCRCRSGCRRQWQNCRRGPRR